ncbi:MAG: hypothetical protein K6D02_02285 [Lachnospiraceae bacterium]|nr:hypothetical protein [Lachnospiraceae bacterium]
MNFKIKKIGFAISVLILLFGTAAFSFVKPVSTNKIKTTVNVIKTNSKDYSKISTFTSVSTTEEMSAEEIEKDITALVLKYYDAKQKVDMDILKECVSDINDVNEEKFKSEAQYIEKYENINCYILNAKEEGAYRVYVECDIKGYKVETLMPALYALYVKQNDKGENVIFLGNFSRKEQKNIAELDNTPVVKKLKDKVDKDLKKILEDKDNKDAAEFYKMINEADKKIEESKEKVEETDSKDEKKDETEATATAESKESDDSKESASPESSDSKDEDKETSSPESTKE